MKVFALNLSVGFDNETNRVVARQVLDAERLRLLFPNDSATSGTQPLAAEQGATASARQHARLPGDGTGKRPRTGRRRYRQQCLGCRGHFIKHMKNDLASDRTSCTSFLANFMRLLLHAAAYTLHQQLRTQALRHTALSQAQPSTVINKLFIIAVQVRQTNQRTVLHLPNACAVKNLLHAVSERLFICVPARTVNSS